MAAKDSDHRPQRAGKPAAASRGGKAAHGDGAAKKPVKKPAKPTPEPVEAAEAAPAEKSAAGKSKAKGAPKKAESAAKAPVAKAPATPTGKATGKSAVKLPPKSPGKSPEKAVEKTPEKHGAKPAAKAPTPPTPKLPAAKPPAPRKATPVALDDDFGDVGDDFEEEAEPAAAEPDEPEKPAAEEAAEAPEVDEDLGLAEAVAAAVAGAAPAAPKKKPALPIPPMPPRSADGTVTIAYSPDSDDAFMMYALENGKVDTEDRKYACTRADIQVLNEEAKKGTYDVTALSFGAYPVVNDRYALLPCGGSFGDNQGPILIAKTPIRASEVNGLTVAVPGMLTTATMVLRLWLPRANLKLVPVPFDQIVATVKAGKARAGVLIHEGQLMWREEGLARVADFGQWWGEKTEGLPLPLGGNAIRRDIKPEERAKIALDLKRSIAYALGHREEALEYALKFARGLEKAKVDKYVSMYVNELTLDVGERGRQAVRLLLDEAHRAGILAKPVEVEFA